MVAHHKKIDLVIPCAGMGTRLGYLTKFVTKNMVVINDKSIIEHQLDKFLVHKKKINKIHFILGYRAPILKSYIKKLKLPFKIKFHINKKFYITDVIKVKSSPNKIITDKTKSSRKIKKNLFDIRVQNKIITVSTS